ncbi:MAG: glycine cleavage system aminomethyltransferase GcvT [Nitrospinae bacterium]|nr:glycine cleavage system aminomethyltransferase GcvT [Nitrospinota bacterium]
MKKTVLYPWHVAAGAKIVEFGGWQMPVQYAGVLAEHEAVRQRAGIFDVSHMGEVFISGPDARAFVNRLVTNDISLLEHGAVAYSVMCDDEGHTIDDLLVYCMGPRSFLLIVNASNAEKDFNWISTRIKGENVQALDRSADYGLIAVQGPLAAGIVAKVAPFPADLKYYHFCLAEWRGTQLLVSRTGYTGEDGVEIMVETARTAELWDALMEAGKDQGLAPAGLAVRDVLRIESGYSLYGHELDETADPISAGLSWVVKMDGHDFIGKPALQNLKPSRKKIAFIMEGKNIPRQGFHLKVDGAECGVVTSGTFSPVLQKPVGIGYISADRGLAPGSRLSVDIRGKEAPASVCKLPFIKPGVLR